MQRIRLQAIVVFGDGVAPTHGPSDPPSEAGKSWGQYVRELADDTNDVYERQGVGFRVDFDPDADVAFASSTLLNGDDDPDGAPDPNGNAPNPHQFARQVEAWKYPGRAVVFLRHYDPGVSDDPVFSTGSRGDYVVFDKGADEVTGSALAHELGHFFHLSHTFRTEAKSVEDARKIILRYVEHDGHPVADGLKVFDGDAPAVTDTPPDAGWKIFDSEHESRCSGPDVIEIDVTFGDGTGHTYPLHPDRTNLMSYFNRGVDPKCTAHRTLTPMQRSVMEASLRTGNRSGLLHTAAMLAGDKAYFFKDDRYIRYDVSSDRADAGYPKSIAAGWPGLWSAGLDAAAVWPDGRTYFFRGDEYVKYDRDRRKVFDGYPKKIADHWPGVWPRDLDAVMVLDAGTAWFFRGSRCQRYDIARDEAVGERESIASRWRGVWGGGIDAALAWKNGKAYFLKGDRYARYDLASKATDQDFHRIEGFWPGLWPEGVDAAVAWNDGTIRFVRGERCIAYTMLGDEASGGSFPVSAAGWKGFPWTDANGFGRGCFDAAAIWNNGKAYFFRGGEYLRLDLEKGEVDRGPRPISEGWDGLGDGRIDAVVRWNNGKAYFFRGDHYFQVDVGTRKVIAGPLSITRFWKGVFAADLNAVVALWDRGKAYFFKGDRYIRYDIAADRADEGYPAGVTAGGWPGLRWD